MLLQHTNVSASGLMYGDGAECDRLRGDNTLCDRADVVHGIQLLSTVIMLQMYGMLQGCVNFCGMNERSSDRRNKAINQRSSHMPIVRKQSLRQSLRPSLQTIGGHLIGETPRVTLLKYLQRYCLGMVTSSVPKRPVARSRTPMTKVVAPCLIAIVCFASRSVARDGSD